MITTIFNYDNPLDYLMTDAEISAGKARLLPVANPTIQHFDQLFSSDVGFTYDALKAEFVGGKVRQKDQRPMGATFGATYTNNINGSWGNGVLTGAGTGSPGVAGGKLILQGGTKFVQYAALNNADSLQEGCIRLKYTPNYSGIPVATRNIFCISQSPSSPNNLIALYHAATSGGLFLLVYSSTGAAIVSANLGVWSPVSGTEYEIEVNFDITSGATRLFIDGIQFGSTAAGTGTRSGTIGIFNIGAYYPGTSITDASYNDVEVFSAVQHTANYTPGYTVPENSYAASTVVLPIHTYTGIGHVVSFYTVSIIQTNDPRFIINDKYWNGSAWVTSNGTWAQSNTQTDFTTNLPTLPAADSFIIKILFNDGNLQMDVDDIDTYYVGQWYAEGTITTNVYLRMSAGISAASVEEIDYLAPDLVYYGLIVDGILKWWNGGSWANSDGTTAELNNISDINTHMSSLIPTAFNKSVKVFARLFSGDGSTTPKLDSVTISYTFGGLEPAAPSRCFVYGYLLDIIGNPIAGATVSVKRVTALTQYDEAGSHMIGDNKETTTDSTGYWELELIRSSAIESATKTYQLSYYSETFSKSKIGSNKITFSVPDQDEVNITDLLTAA